MKKLLLLISITSSIILNAIAPVYGFGGPALSLKYIFKNYPALIKPQDPFFGN